MKDGENNLILRYKKDVEAIFFKKRPLFGGLICYNCCCGGDFKEVITNESRKIQIGHLY